MILYINRTFKREKTNYILNKNNNIRIQIEAFKKDIISDKENEKVKMEPKDLMKQIKENNNKIDACNRHDFSIDITPHKKFHKRYRCTNCSGDVSSTDKHWYDKGIEHGKA